MNDDARVRGARPSQPHAQPDEGASSDGDRSWTEDPITVDPDEDRSVDAVIEHQDQTQGTPAVDRDQET